MTSPSSEGYQIYLNKRKRDWAQSWSQKQKGSTLSAIWIARSENVIYFSSDVIHCVCGYGFYLLL